MLGLILALLGLLYYGTVNRKAVSRAGKLFLLQSILLWKIQSASVVFKSGKR